MKRTLKEILAEYGRVAFVVYFAIFFATLLGTWTAINFGWRPESASGSMGTIAAAYLTTKIAQPLRIAATVALTPLAAKVYERMRRKSVVSPGASASIDPGS